MFPPLRSLLPPPVALVGVRSPGGARVLEAHRCYEARQLPRLRRTAESPAILGVAEEQELLGSGSADVAQPALFVESLQVLLALARTREAVREEALLAAGDDDQVVLQALAGVKSHQPDGLAALPLLFRLV